MALDRDLLTLIITTSPTPSAPSTDLLSAAFQSYQAHCPELLRCPIVVVFDTYEQVVPVSRLKKGQVTPAGARDYNAYKENVKNLVTKTFAHDAAGAKRWTTSEEEAEYGSPRTSPVPLVLNTTSDGSVAFIEAKERLGFGLAVRSALRATHTPFVWIHQHDWALSALIPLPSILDVMQQSANDETAPIRYVCLPSQRMVHYATSNHVEKFPALKSLTAALQRDFPSTRGPDVPLTPLYFWHDKPHIADRKHYLARVFPSTLAITRGAFIEDTIGHRARDQMKAGLWAKWACWLYAPGGGEEVCVRHLHGRVWEGDERHQAKIARWKEEGKQQLRDPKTNAKNTGEQCDTMSKMIE